MKLFLTKLMTLGLFLLSLGCFYLATTIAFPTYFINVALFLVALFVLLQGCGKMDEIHGFGPHCKKNNENTVKQIDSDENNSELNNNE